MKNGIIKAAALALVAGCGAAASADTVTMRYTGNTGLNSISLAGGSANNGDRQAGHLSYQFQGGGSYNSFCVELVENVNSSFTTYEIVDLSEAPRSNNPDDAGDNYGQSTADAVIAVLAKAVDLGWIDTSLQATPGGADSESNADRMSAIQAAIWAALFGASTSSSDSDVAIALDQLSSQPLSSGTFDLMQSRVRAAVADGAQDQLYVVPLPGAAWAGLGMLGLCAGVRTLRRR